MPKPSRSGENSLKYATEAIEISLWSHALTIVFGGRNEALDALYGLTYAEVKTLRYLLLRCFKNYHSKHPAEFSLALLLDYAEKKDETLGI